MKSVVSVIGLGYVGLSTAVCMASRGIKTIGVEIDQNKLTTIRSGIVPFHEEGLGEMLSQTTKDGTFTSTDNVSEAVQNSRISIIAVGTPSRVTGEIDTSYVLEASRRIGEAIGKKSGRHIVVVKSSVVPGTTGGPVKRELENRTAKKAGKDFGLAVNPEFLREGTAVYDTFHPDALVLGSNDRRTLADLKKLFLKFYGNLPPTIETSLTNAEFIKYSVNTFRAVQLSFLNTLANLSSVIPDSEVGDVIQGLSTITKLDERYLRPGPGFGGSCLPKDTRAMVVHMKNNGVNPSLLESALLVNNLQSKVIVDMAEQLVGNLSGKKISVLGLSFKGNTDDVRESPALNIIKELLARGAKVSSYDPKALKNAKKILDGSIVFAKDVRGCLKESECCIVATDWKEFIKLEPEAFLSRMKRPIVVDARRIFTPSRFIAKGVVYRRLGTSG